MFHHLFDYARADLEEAAVQLAYIELEEEKIAEKRQRGLPSLPARDTRFPQFPPCQNPLLIGGVQLGLLHIEIKKESFSSTAEVG